MQQYRVNYTLLIGLIIGAFVSSGAVYGLWKFQVERKSGWLKREAERASASHDVRKAKEYYGQYLSIHPEDMDSRWKYADAIIDVTNAEDATVLDIRDALGVMETMLRNPALANMPEAKKVRRRLIEVYARDSVRNYAPALEHLNMLLEADPQNGELQVLRASYLAKSGDLENAVKYSYQLVGYDPRADKFDVKKATSPEVYTTLATILRGKQNKPELAERVVDRMVEANPKSFEAYLQRGRLRSVWGNKDGARADAEQAFQLKPDDTNVLLFLADVDARDDQFEKAYEYIEKVKKLHPDEVRVYQAAAALEIKQQMAAKPDARQQYYDKAIAQIEEGIKKVPAAKALELQFFKAELQIPAQDIKGARETIQTLSKMRNLRPEVIDYFEARILLAEGKWFDASEALNKLRAKMGDFGRDRAMEVDYSLGLCYERLGRYDMANEQYKLVLQGEPQNEPAKAGVQRTAAMMGNSKPNTISSGDDWQKELADQLQKPKEQRNFTKLDAMLDKIAKDRQLDETMTLLLKAQVMMMREDYDDAAKLLTEAKKLSPITEAKKPSPQNMQVQRMIVQLARMNPKVGPEKALEILKRVETDFSDQPALRLDKADILIQMNKDQQDKEPLKRELANLFAGIDQWTTAQKIELWSGMAGRYLSLNMPDEGRQYLTLAADNQPNELPLRLALFSLALDAGDDEGMKQAQAKILQIVGDQNDSNWLYAEARRKLLLLRRGRLGLESLEEIRGLANQALKQRPDWFELHALLAEIELLSNHGALALEHYDRAEQLGRPTPAQVAAHIRLLAGNGRYADAGKLIDRIPEGGRQVLLGPLYAEILFRSHQTEAAIKQAKTATENDPKNAQNYYWYGQLLARSAQATDITPQRRNEIMAEAIQAMQRAAELQPEFPDAWFALINYHAMQKDEAQAQKTMRDAQLALSGDNLTIFLARSYELLHRWFDAETMYREIYETTPDDLGRAQQLAAFYLGPIYQRPDRREKATPLINQILKAGAEKKLAANDSNLLWARRMAAKILSTTNEYQNMLKAEKLLASNSQDGSLLLEDKLAMAEILASRTEPLSRLKAIGLLEEADKVQSLNDLAQIQLGELYYAVGGFSSKYTEQMDKVTSLFPNSVEARQSYAEKLLARGDQRSLDSAARHVNKLRELAPNNPATFELTVRLAGKLGKQKAVRDDLVKRIPKIADIKDMTPAQAQSLGMFANLFVALGDLDSAEKIYTELAAKDPAMVFQLAQFLGTYRDADKCFVKLNEVYTPAKIPDILQIALGVARQQRDKVGDKYDADIQRWLDTGLRENPESIPLLITQADLNDLQKKYDAAADVYRKLLTRNDLTGIRRAVVLNNLSFLLALDTSAKAADDPLKLVEEAEQILGPNSDILDTKAVVRVSQKDYKSAIRDLELAVTDNPTSSKYYHKAVAHLLNNENKAAVEAWEKAEALGLKREDLNRMEFDQFDDMKKKIDQIRQRKVTQAEAPRKAG